MKKILIVDGNSILNRAFYGVRPLTTRDGIPTNAVYGMVTILSKHLSNLSPELCAIAFDLKSPTFRHKLYDGYKANRHGMPDELAAQLPYARECAEFMGFNVLQLEGFEADDILGTLAAEAQAQGADAYILTGDRDSLQLIDDHVHVLLATNKETVEIGRKEFFEKYGVNPEQFVDVKALMGDSSDNIPGVPGIGEKTALKLISDYGTLDSLYEKFEDSDLTASVKNKLRDGKDKAYLSKTLATICREAPVEHNFDSLVNGGIRKKELLNLFEKLEFSGLIKRFSLDELSSEAHNNGVKAENTVAANEGEQAPAKAEKCEISSDGLEAVISGKTVAIACDDEKISVYDSEKIYSFELCKETASVVADALGKAHTVCHDCKKIYKILSSYGVSYEGAYFDVMLAAYVIDPSRTKYGIDELYLSYCGHVLSEDTDISVAVYQIYLAERDKIVSDGLEKLLDDIEMPLAGVLADMEIRGFKVDTAGISEYGKALAYASDALAERIYCYAGGEFNINSPKQLGEVLFEKLCLPKPKKTKTGYSTDAETLGKLSKYHPVIEDILEYRQLTKLKSTYADGLCRVADADGIIHTSFNQTGTATGRLSSAEPNLQNIPIKTELGREFRKFFIPSSPDRVIIDADYSQIELRLLAHVSGDEEMIRAFAEGRDIHTSTAATVFGVSPENVTPELRKKAKAVNFGIVYGIGEYSLSEDLGISRVQAKEYIDSYLAGFPKVGEYLSGVKEAAKRDGYVTTLFGRRRYIPELSAKNKNLQHFGERVAMNSPIQGTAADIIKIAMINVRNRLRESGLDAYLILQVHDELILDSAPECADSALGILVHEMENAAQLSVPLSVEAHIGKTWFEAK